MNKILSVSNKIKEIRTKIGLINLLKQLPDHRLREFDEITCNIAMSNQNNRYVFSEWLETIVDEYLYKYNNSGNTDERDIAFGAFATRACQLRRDKAYKKTRDYVEKYSPAFRADYPFWEHLQKESWFHDENITSDQIYEIFDWAEHYINALPENSGTYHIYAIALLDILDNIDVENPEYAGFLSDKYNFLCKAREYAKDAIKIETEKFGRTYAKYHCTYGRILTLLGDYKEAVKQIKIAIEEESDSKKDYYMRISEFRLYLNIAQYKYELSKSVATIKREMTEIKNSTTMSMDNIKNETLLKIETDMKNTSTKNLEYLGFFSGIIAILIGSLSIANAFESPIALSGVILLMIGGILIAYSALAIVLHDRKDKICRSVLIIGIMLIIIGILLQIISTETVSTRLIVLFSGLMQK